MRVGGGVGCEVFVVFDMCPGGLVVLLGLVYREEGRGIGGFGDLRLVINFCFMLCNDSKTVDVLDLDRHSLDYCTSLSILFRIYICSLEIHIGL